MRPAGKYAGGSMFFVNAANGVASIRRPRLRLLCCKRTLGQTRVGLLRPGLGVLCVELRLVRTRFGSLRPQPGLLLAQLKFFWSWLRSVRARSFARAGLLLFPRLFLGL